ncbi:MAG: acetate kinase [Faecalibacterium sp.]
MKILVLNCGSSSLKFQFIDMETEQVLAKGLCERIGAENSLITYEANDKEFQKLAIYPTHRRAIYHIVEILTSGESKVIDDVAEVSAIGHRVVHGGEHFRVPTLCTEAVIEALRGLNSLAPLHNPAAIQGLRCAAEVFGDAVPNVAVFDTSFHSTMPAKAYMYALPYEYYKTYGVRRYGFHGTSHNYVSHEAAKFLGKPFDSLRLISCHLGNGASVAAVDHGKVVDTSMGMTPLAGLMMGTRCGDIDPSAVNYLKYNLNITGYELDEILNKKSGLLGVSGLSSDKRDLNEAYQQGNERAQLAVDMFNYDIRKTIGAYMFAMGGVDAILFTGGIGENDASTREAVCAGENNFGVSIDKEKNNTIRVSKMGTCDVSAPDASVRLLVVPTNEELMIARQTAEVVTAQ